MTRELQVKEALERMVMLNLSRQCINAFKQGKVWESEGPGSLYEVNETEQSYIDKFEEKYNAVVYHMIHNKFEFGECYAMLYVSKDKVEWQEDRYDIEDHTPMVYVYNVDEPMFSEFGCIGIRPSIGGLVRVS